LFCVYYQIKLLNFIMPRIIGVNIPDNKQIGIALGYIYGIGFSSAQKVLAEAKINPAIKAKDLTPEQLKKSKKSLKKIIA